MDPTLAERMHELLRHRPAQHPSSCPVCEDEARHAALERDRLAGLNPIDLPREDQVPEPVAARAERAGGGRYRGDLPVSGAGPIMHSRWQGRCPSCDGIICRGDTIRLTEDGWLHEGCANP